jgi:hypothetical protein
MTGRGEMKGSSVPKYHLLVPSHFFTCPQQGSVQLCLPWNHCYYGATMWLVLSCSNPGMTMYPRFEVMLPGPYRNQTQHSQPACNNPSLSHYVEFVTNRKLSANEHALFHNPDQSIVALPQLPPRAEPLHEWYQSEQIVDILDSFHNYLTDCSRVQLI